MTAAQKKSRDNFKKAALYRKRTGCTLKEAFAHVKKGSVTGLDKVVKKGNRTTVLYTKKTTKKADTKKKTTQGKLFGVMGNIITAKTNTVYFVNYPMGSHLDFFATSYTDLVNQIAIIDWSYKPQIFELITWRGKVEPRRLTGEVYKTIVKK